MCFISPICINTFNKMNAVELKDIDYLGLTVEQQIIVLALYNATDNPKAGLRLDINHAQQNGYELKQYLIILSTAISQKDPVFDDKIGQLFLNKTPKEFVASGTLLIA